MRSPYTPLPNNVREETDHKGDWVELFLEWLYSVHKSLGLAINEWKGVKEIRFLLPSARCKRNYRFESCIHSKLTISIGFLSQLHLASVDMFTMDGIQKATDSFVTTTCDTDTSLLVCYLYGFTCWCYTARANIDHISHSIGEKSAIIQRHLGRKRIKYCSFLEIHCIYPIEPLSGSKKIIFSNICQRKIGCSFKSEVKRLLFEAGLIGSNGVHGKTWRCWSA